MSLMTLNSELLHDSYQVNYEFNYIYLFSSLGIDQIQFN